jgi:hypothetical protein
MKRSALQVSDGVIELARQPDPEARAKMIAAMLELIADAVASELDKRDVKPNEDR